MAFVAGVVPGGMDDKDKDSLIRMAAFEHVRRLSEVHGHHAALIVADKHERLGQAVVPNGLPLSKRHHAAFAEAEGYRLSGSRAASFF